MPDSSELPHRPDSLSYSNYVRSMIECVQLTNNNLRILESTGNETGSKHLIDGLMKIHADLLSSIAFLVEHPVNTRDGKQIAGEISGDEFQTRFETIFGGGDGEINISSGNVCMDMAVALAQAYEYLVNVVVADECMDAFNSGLTKMRSDVHQLLVLKNALWDYIKDVGLKTSILAEFANPYIKQIGPDGKVLGADLDEDRLLNFGNAFAAGVASGALVADIEDALAYANDTSLRSLLVPLYRDHQDAVHRINADYFGDYTCNGFSHLAALLNDWACLHAVTNRPCSIVENVYEIATNYDEVEIDPEGQPEIEVEIIYGSYSAETVESEKDDRPVDGFGTLYGVKVKFPKGSEGGEFDVIEYNARPFDPHVPNIPVFTEDGKLLQDETPVEFFLRGRGHPEKRGLDIPMTACQLENLEFPGGIAQTLSLN